MAGKGRNYQGQEGWMLDPIPPFATYHALKKVSGAGPRRPIVDWPAYTEVRNICTCLLQGGQSPTPLNHSMQCMHRWCSRML